MRPALHSVSRHQAAFPRAAVPTRPCSSVSSLSPEVQGFSPRLCALSSLCTSLSLSVPFCPSYLLPVFSPLCRCWCSRSGLASPQVLSVSAPTFALRGAWSTPHVRAVENGAHCASVLHHPPYTHPPRWPFLGSTVGGPCSQPAKRKSWT